MTDPFVVVGGDAAGLSAASKLKRDDPDREVIVFEKGRWVSYAHCGTPYFVKGDIEHLSDLLALSPEEIEERGIDLRREHEVVAVSPDERTVTVRTADGDAVEQAYGDLLVATGAHAATSPIEGAALDGVFTLHGLDSAAAIRAFLDAPDAASVEAVGGGEYVDRETVARYGAMDPPETVALVGGGYVGIEMAEAFAAHDLDVHLFQRSAHVLQPFGEAVAERVEEHLREQGVTLHLDTEVDRLAGDDGRVTGVSFGDGPLDVDMVLVGIGIRPNTDLLAGTGVELGDSGAIATDEYGRTNVEGVYAAGDVAEDRHVVTGGPAWVPLGLTANRAGRAIGGTVAGDPTPVGDVAGTAVLKAFDLECGRTGVVDHEEAREAGFDPVSETITAGSRSGYYPGAAETTVTLTADRDSGKLLGGTIVGSDRAAIRIDTVATALAGELTVSEVERLDLAYAPPFSPVWDPVLTAAKVLGGKL
ncbi:NADPH-dependent 2,4-dienoyl-CoA reductase, sulfur reductase [Halogranum gelatinilyticum]|uniref:NADPH-dependent 2,4-dienoyl-CoA reductase, sulfur reductase n=1 Tax=Halogranum gelatinilyticum TaxID=660521 RepID=A0A1G9XYL4_9EURY|nr:FAD-dependent oxidoreductase [Halogranum gelatinilyticum]SDN01844.1 NADPH-dependent 2,4-dienoyl-CoA reductase, sulfur reductase [Halogranum gelatinilyticum]